MDRQEASPRFEDEDLYGTSYCDGAFPNIQSPFADERDASFVNLSVMILQRQNKDRSTSFSFKLIKVDFINVVMLRTSDYNISKLLSVL